MLTECLIFLLCDLVEQGLARDVLHDQVDVLLVIVGLVVLHDVRVIKLVQNCDLLHDAVNIVFQLDFVEDFYGDLEAFIVLIFCLKDAAERTNAENFSGGVDVVVHFELADALLLTTLASPDLLSLWAGHVLFGRFSRFSIKATHLNVLNSF